MYFYWVWDCILSLCNIRTFLLSKSWQNVDCTKYMCIFSGHFFFFLDYWEDSKPRWVARTLQWAVEVPNSVLDYLYSIHPNLGKSLDLFPISWKNSKHLVLLHVTESKVTVFSISLVTSDASCRVNLSGCLCQRCYPKLLHVVPPSQCRRTSISALGMGLQWIGWSLE